MSRVLNYVPGIACFLAGAVVAAVTLPKRKSGGMDAALSGEWQRSIVALASRIEGVEAASATRFAQLETRLEEQGGRLAGIPSAGQIVAAVEQSLTKAMASLDNRLGTQAYSIEVLKTTVSQTDGLLERVLESLDSLQSFRDPADNTEGSLPSRARM
jgi:uncharacterized coiled-coil protein SlyX